jgi:hypothetical protein
MKFHKLLIIFLFVMVGWLALGSPMGVLADVSTETTSGANYKGPNITIQGVFNLFNSLVCYFVQIVLVFMVIALIWAGVKYLKSQGAGPAVSDANKNLKWVIVGIAVVLGTYTIIASIASFVGSSLPLIPLNCSNTVSNLGGQPNTNPGGGTNTGTTGGNGQFPVQSTSVVGSKSIGELCSKASECRTGSCDGICFNVNGHPNGEPCALDYQCKSGYCVPTEAAVSYCADHPPGTLSEGEACLYDEWCAAGMRCLTQNGQKFGACTVMR